MEWATGQRRPGADNRANHGGSWNNNADNCTVSNRNNNSPDNRNNNLGFRFASSHSPIWVHGPMMTGSWICRLRLLCDHLISRLRHESDQSVPASPLLVGRLGGAKVELGGPIFITRLR
jgi:hypothetical protein